MNTKDIIIVSLILVTSSTILSYCLSYPYNRVAFWSTWISGFIILILISRRRRRIKYRETKELNKCQQ